MKNFEQIEKDFFEIDEIDDNSILAFFYANKDYFDSIDINEEAKGQKNLWMLSEIINSAYKQKDYGLIKTYKNSTIDRYKDYSLKFDYDLKTDTFFKSLIFNVAINYFNNKKYYWATKYFRVSLNLEKDNFQLINFHNESKYRFIKKISKYAGWIGLSLIIIKYFSIFMLDFDKNNFVIIGYLGAILLIGYGLTEIMIKKPSH